MLGDSHLFSHGSLHLQWLLNASLCSLRKRGSGGWDKMFSSFKLKQTDTLFTGIRAAQSTKLSFFNSFITRENCVKCCPNAHLGGHLILSGMNVSFIHGGTIHSE